MGGGQPLVELVVDGRQDSLQPRHIDLSVVVQCVEPVVTKGFDHVPDIHQMNCEGVGVGGQTDRLCSIKSVFMLEQTLLLVTRCHNSWKGKKIFKNLRVLTVASLLHKPEFAGSPVSRQSDYIEVLSSCKKKIRSQIHATSVQLNEMKLFPDTIGLTEGTF